MRTCLPLFTSCIYRSFENICMAKIKAPEQKIDQPKMMDKQCNIVEAVGLFE